MTDAGDADRTGQLLAGAWGWIVSAVDHGHGIGARDLNDALDAAAKHAGCDVPASLRPRPRG